jgi:transcriptional regulator with PAS, ATPase and Fis domain
MGPIENENICSEWWKDFSGAVTICDQNGTIVAMNAKSQQTFANSGGAALIGKNVLDCHPEPARTKLKQMLADRKSNSYTIEKKGIKKLIYQTPLFRDSVYAGFVELSLEIPQELPHFVRG